MGIDLQPVFVVVTDVVVTDVVVAAVVVGWG